MNIFRRKPDPNAPVNGRPRIGRRYRTRSRFDWFKLGWVLFPLFFLLVICLIFAGTIASNINDQQVTVKIEDKERVRSGDTDKYLLFTDKGTFENTDSLFEGKFNSSDVYGELERGKTYDCHVQGFRIPILSMYQNIIECEEV